MVAHSASHGSVLAVTVNAHPRRENSQGADMLEQVRAELGEERVPADITLESLRGSGLAEFYRRVGTSELEEALSNANAVRVEGQLLYKQLFNFQYEDGARMVTFGGVFYRADRQAEFDACAFDKLPFVKTDHETFRIKSPKLTIREISHIERQLPLREGHELDLGPIPEEDAREYLRLYRFLPAYFPVEMA
jgi:hypothetical protein